MVALHIFPFLLRHGLHGDIWSSNFAKENSQKKRLHVDGEILATVIAAAVAAVVVEASVEAGELRPAEIGPGTAEVVPEFEFDFFFLVFLTSGNGEGWACTARSD